MTPEQDNAVIKVPESEPGARSSLVIIAGTYGRSVELRQFLSNNGFRLIGSDFALPPTGENYRRRLWPRNAYTQLGKTIFSRPGVSREALNWALSSYLGKEAPEFNFTEHELLGDGGKVFSANHHVLLPAAGLNDEDLRLVFGAGEFDIIRMPFPLFDDYRDWFDSDRRRKFEADKLRHGETTDSLASAYHAWYLRTFDESYAWWRADLDLFLALIQDNQGGVTLAVDEIYQELYPKSVEAAAKQVGIQTVDCVEVAFGGCNFFRAKDIVLVPREAPRMKQWLENNVVGPGHVVDFPAKWVADYNYGSGFHCLFNEIDLKPFK